MTAGVVNPGVCVRRRDFLKTGSAALAACLRLTDLPAKALAKSVMVVRLEFEGDPSWPAPPDSL